MLNLTYQKLNKAEIISKYTNWIGKVATNLSKMKTKVSIKKYIWRFDLIYMLLMKIMNKEIYT